MDKDNSQESMISSNSPSFGKSRGEAYYKPVTAEKKLRTGNGRMVTDGRICAKQ